MSRIPTPTLETAPEAAQPQLAAVGKQLGTVPNLFRIVANSPVALDAYLGFSGAIGRGTLPAATRERIALAVAEINGCDYCLSAHSFIAEKLVHLGADEIAASRDGHSADPKAEAALRLATVLARGHGRDSETALEAALAAGYTPAAIVEIIAHVALNVFTNTVNVALGTEVDFPLVTARASASASR